MEILCNRETWALSGELSTRTFSKKSYLKVFRWRDCFMSLEFVIFQTVARELHNSLWLLRKTRYRGWNIFCNICTNYCYGQDQKITTVILTRPDVTLWCILLAHTSIMFCILCKKIIYYIFTQPFFYIIYTNNYLSFIYTSIRFNQW